MTVARGTGEQVCYISVGAQSISSLKLLSFYLINSLKDLVRLIIEGTVINDLYLLLLNVSPSRCTGVLEVWGKSALRFKGRSPLRP